MFVLLFLAGLVWGIIIGGFLFEHKWKRNAHHEQVVDRFYKVVDLRSRPSIKHYNFLFHMQMAEYHPSKWMDDWRELTGEGGGSDD